jgi:uncharacterized metal-binding protein YceD (DUF177 family)
MREVKVDDIEDGEEGFVEANDGERRAIARVLDLQALKSLTFAYRLRRHGGGRIGLEGRLRAAVTQTCVVSLEPVESDLDVPVDMEFWPPSLIDQLEREAADSDHALRDWPEPILDGKIDLGPVVYETLATALDPYPRAEGASVDWQSSEPRAEGGEKADSPFAVLARLKQDK